MALQNYGEKLSFLYKIHIHGILDEHWSEWFYDYVVAIEVPESHLNRTLLIVRVPDQAALRGILNRIWDLNLGIISVAMAQDNEAL